MALDPIKSTTLSGAQVNRHCLMDEFHVGPHTTTTASGVVIHQWEWIEERCA